MNPRLPDKELCLVWLALLCLIALAGCRMPNQELSAIQKATPPVPAARMRGGSLAKPAGLASSPEPEETLPAAGSAVLFTPTSTPAAPTLSPSPAPFTPSPLALLHPISITATALLTPISFAASFQHCSPLESTSLADLPLIISDPYHPPPMGSDERHQGVDFSYFRRGERTSIQGDGVQSVLAGKVAAAIQGSFPFGNMVIIETPHALLSATLAKWLEIGEGESLYILYAHMESVPLVSQGESVFACQLLDWVGKTGNAAVAHLHLETRIGPPGHSFSSMGYYLAQNTPEERQNYLLWRTSGVFRHFDPMELLK